MKVGLVVMDEDGPWFGRPSRSVPYLPMGE
jgi:hypothetical protein